MQPNQNHLLASCRYVALDECLLLYTIILSQQNCAVDSLGGRLEPSAIGCEIQRPGNRVRVFSADGTEPFLDSGLLLPMRIFINNAACHNMSRESLSVHVAETVVHLRLTAMSVRGPAGRWGIASQGRGFTAFVRPCSLCRLAESSGSGAMMNTNRLLMLDCWTNPTCKENRILGSLTQGSAEEVRSQQVGQARGAKTE